MSGVTDADFAMPAYGKHVSYPITDDDLDVDLDETMTTYPITSSMPRVRSTEIRPNNGPSVVPKPAPVVARHARHEDEHHRRGTLDLGLLLLRVSVGGIMLFLAYRSSQRTQRTPQ